MRFIWTESEKYSGCEYDTNDESQKHLGVYWHYDERYDDYEEDAKFV